MILAEAEAPAVNCLIASAWRYQSSPLLNYRNLIRFQLAILSSIRCLNLRAAGPRDTSVEDQGELEGGGEERENSRLIRREFA